MTTTVQIIDLERKGDQWSWAAVIATDAITVTTFFRTALDGKGLAYKCENEAIAKDYWVMLKTIVGPCAVDLNALMPDDRLEYIQRIAYKYAHMICG